MELAAADCKWHRRHCVDADFLHAKTIREAYPFDETKLRDVRGRWSVNEHHRLRRHEHRNDQVIDLGPKKIYCDTCGVFIVDREGSCLFYFCGKCRDRGRKLELCAKCYRRGELGSGPRRGPTDIFETREERASKRERTHSGSSGPPSRAGSGRRSGGVRGSEVTHFSDENGVRRPISPLRTLLSYRALISRVSAGGDYNANLGGAASWGTVEPLGSARSGVGSHAPSSVRSGRTSVGTVGVASVGTVGAASVNAKRCSASFRSRSSSDDEEQPRLSSRDAATAATSSELPAQPPTGEWKGTITEEGVTRSTNRQLRFAESGALTGSQTGEGFDVAISGAFVAKMQTVSWVEVHSWGRVKFDGHVTWSSGNFVIQGTFVTTDESKGKLELTRPP
jgi:hypothetical protein